MSRSEETVKQIISQIEGEKEEKTIDEVLGIFLENDNKKQDDTKSDCDFHFDMKELQHWKEQANQTYSIKYDREILCFHKYFRKPIIFLKRLIRKMCRSLIQPLVEEQNAFNSNVTAAINALYNNEIVTQAFMAEKASLAKAEGADEHYVDEAIDRFEKRIHAELDEQNKSFLFLNEKVDSIEKSCRDYINAELNGVENRYQDYINTEIEKWDTSNKIFVIEEIAKSQKMLSDEIIKMKSELKEGYDKQTILLERRHTQEEMNLFRNTRLKFCKQVTDTKNNVQNTEKDMDIYTGIDYFDFENHFRGSRKEIKDAVSAYIPYFKQKDHVLDLGCGRGEFLELLKENGISGIGVDNYEEFVAYCKAKELNAVCEDALNYLMKSENNSVGGIFASQLIEHLTNEKLLKLCCLAYEKLEAGGYLVLETPNPMCLSIYMNAFYIDPSHQKPVHPKTMEYILKREGFQEIEILFTEKSKSSYRLPLLVSETVQNLSEFNDGINLLSDLLFGSQDYAIIAKK